MKKEFDLLGKVFHDWTVLQLSEYKSSSDRDRYWDCRCKCGIQKPVRACYLKNGQSKRCVDCAHEKQIIRGREIPLGYWSSLKNNASKRSIEFNITKENVIFALKNQSNKCALSGLPVKFADTASDHLRGETTASVDRIDSSKGYFVNNIQIVHKTINYMKHTLTQEEFLFFCESVINNNR